MVINKSEIRNVPSPYNKNSQKGLVSPISAFLTYQFMPQLQLTTLGNTNVAGPQGAVGSPSDSRARGQLLADPEVCATS